MGKSVSFDLKGLEKKLNQIEKVFLKEAAEQALKSFGFESRRILAEEMKRRFDNPTQYTLRSPRFVHRGSVLRIYINDDSRQNQSAARYLQPTDSSGGIKQKEQMPTSLSAVLQKFGTRKVAAPVPGSRAGRQFLRSDGRLRPLKVRSLISQLTAPGGNYRERYVLITERRGNGLGPGIWRKYRAKDSVSLAFALLDQKPWQETNFDFRGVLLESARERLPVLVEQKLQRLVR